MRRGYQSLPMTVFLRHEFRGTSEYEDVDTEFSGRYPSPALGAALRAVSRDSRVRRRFSARRTQWATQTKGLFEGSPTKPNISRA